MFGISFRRRRPVRPLEVRPGDRHVATVSPVVPAEGFRTIPVPVTLSEASGAREVQPALRPPLRTPNSGPRTSKLDALTPVLGRRKAGQALWAPELLTAAERRKAARILENYDR